MSRHLTLYDRATRSAGWNAADPMIDAVLEDVRIELRDRTRASIEVRVGRLGDWWVGSLSGDGLVSAAGEPNARGNDFAFLTLTLPGHGCPASDSPWLREAGRIGLSSCGEGQRIAGGDERLRYVNIHIPLDDLVVAARGRPVPLGRSCSAYSGAGAILSGMLQSLTAAATAGDAGWAADICEDAARIAVKALSAEPHDAAAPAPGTGRLTRVRAYLDAHFAEPLTPREVGRACGVSERQLFRDFALAGTTFAQELRSRRLDLGMRLLVNDRALQIAQIAEHCGFGCQQSFSRAFREAFGSSPHRHRLRRSH